MLDINSFDGEGKLNVNFVDLNCGRQRNGYDCGIYVIHNMKVAVENLCCNDKYVGHDPSDEEITEIRNDLKRKIEYEISCFTRKTTKMVAAASKIDEYIDRRKK